MAYDEAFAERIRDLLGGEPLITEKRMFGGLAFLVGGNMAVAVGQGLLARMEPDLADRLSQGEHVSTAIMGGRSMRGWLRIAPEGVATDEDLRAWVDRSVAFCRALPVKDRIVGTPIGRAD
ncbi:TfoX/Sxy family protein [Tsukamurella sp. 8F]|uniref:TfoX/Sxy family protein n=1 Tax=unclassified Tsukamurella TaxID=2633480 RepID=UPI0023BA3B31|nr:MULTISPECIES: TfoX/Sxy family protein [unclassified Tsukamurella]MDF0529576.1 TfoX/Sxy family protein [Tsukamurella sp. 8J]MDF0585736.1 TfoX/Sxy family protein [Tsukamurella sp. 8F]